MCKFSLNFKEFGNKYTKYDVKHISLSLMNTATLQGQTIYEQPKRFEC